MWIKIRVQDEVELIGEDFETGIWFKNTGTNLQI